ncbi:MAG: hypothetical protein DWQ05_08295 [Calditrichaeota bacterium]|nr:MAG: hypothetical protein DWQ05_08295 [Calditrichota bacterium]
MEVKDYYHILGVPENAGAAEIKRAYREKAKEFHPDANPGDKVAENKFKSVSEAYDILSNKSKRHKYDQIRRYGHPHGGNDWFSFDTNSFNRQTQNWPFEDFKSASGPGFSFTDILKELFGFDGMTRGYPEKDRRSVSQVKTHAEIDITFEESILGVKKLIQISTNEKCPHCLGNGLFMGRPCTVCNGSGKHAEKKKIKLSIPPGIFNGHVLVIRGMGPNKSTNGKPSDLYVKVNVKPHKFFKRLGNDIYCDVPIETDLLEKGVKIRVGTIGGKRVELRIPAGTEKGAVFKISQMGAQKNGESGHQFVVIK